MHTFNKLVYIVKIYLFNFTLMIKAIIIDDEQPARDYFEKLINRYFPNKFAVVEKCSSVGEGIKAINFHSPDLVFLDIRINDDTGFALLKKLEKIDFEVIFTTAHSEYALEAIKQSALDYLLKPINQIELGTAIKKFEKKTEYGYELTRIRLLIENLDTGNKLHQKVALPYENGYRIIKCNTIQYCKSDGNYTLVKLVDSTSFILAKTLKTIEDLLPENLFIRIHKSYLVNQNYIKGYINNNGCCVILNSNEELPIASRKKTEVIEKILHK